MAITAALVKELRERTGAGMMECKKALVETNGDIEVAIENMRKSGQAKAAKKAGRVAAEGICVSAVSESGKSGIIVEINSETDFVARDENFLNFANTIAQVSVKNNIKDIDALKSADYGNGESVDKARENLIAKIGENINVRRISAVEASTALGAYTHGSRISVLVALEGGSEELARDVAMHVAASNPLFINPEDVPEELVNKEKEIFVAQAKESGKPDDIIEKMITGRLKKYVNEISLTGQPFVKEPSQSVGQLLKSASASVESFVRLEVGEGIEKKEEDFAAEVMAQVKGTN
ncbi:MAG: translation elongation factor Ts [Pseudomonadota bacterium]